MSDNNNSTYWHMVQDVHKVSKKAHRPFSKTSRKRKTNSNEIFSNALVFLHISICIMQFKLTLQCKNYHQINNNKKKMVFISYILRQHRFSDCFRRSYIRLL